MQFDESKHIRAVSGQFGQEDGSPPDVQLAEMQVLQLRELKEVLPEDTSKSWSALAPVIPDYAYLSGGTALAIHLRHRVSRDLDFFTETEFDPDDIVQLVSGAGSFVATSVSAGTVNGMFESTKIQFLDTHAQKLVEPTTDWAGLRIAGIGDLMAAKLKVIQDRGALRDYFDIMCMEEQGDLSVDEGLGLLIRKYNPVAPDGLIANVLRGLSYFGDVEDDPGLPADRKDIEHYWGTRVPQIVKALGSH